MQFSDLVFVAGGGGIGSVLRWLVGKLVKEQGPGGFPWSTVLINVTGAFVIGLLSVLFSVEWHDRYGSLLNAGVLTGILGGYTTFSTMQLDAAKLYHSGSPGKTVGYLLGSVVLGILAAGAGAQLARLAG
ncbi:CrcB family protein [Devosia sp. 919]|uniref:fluoride efflux transporter FluC n=1 Tax=Devosia sp. 919 TaxID=2726065 RepID=UPI0015570A32|nr:CrcB family protein [Devosia sp. 919]